MDDGHASSSRNINNNNSTTEIPLATASAMFPGFRFSPTDEELISYYLKKKLEGSDRCVEVISEVEIWRHEPWDLPVKSVIQSDNEWFFFSPRGRKYPNGSQSRRATESGYWKATGKERNVKSGSNVIGTKRTLVFHTGRAPKGQRTQWIMHEYCMNGTRSQPQDSMVVCRLRKNNEFHLNEAPRNQMNDSNANNCMTALSGADPAGSSGGVNAGESCSKECSSSFNSHSVEQIDSGSDSDEKLVNEISLHHPPGHQKDFFDAEDWFADIMKDDIVKLDDSSLNPRLDALPATTTKPEPEPQQNQATMAAQGFTPDLFPFQGTANRRLRLRKEAVGFSEAARGEVLPRCLVSMMSRGRMKRCSIYVCFLSLIILLFCCSALIYFFIWRI
ncbi:PREDICTED: NAC domain-containing protein 60-like isoform X2 [Ipomoea nil]|uniref:NAC domain-containing protein 60-like isoform X2 n=1 Tax=Ipomoea nil TaxID=35883 RepID=UPI000900D46E|nr:PREDICTED: NAC domain-containing protein 60-like isoform X2 [Ipomoea nil]